MKKLWKPVLLLAAIAVMVIGMLGSGAWFTDSKATNTAVLESGTLRLDGAGITSFNLGTIAANMAPGDVTDYVVVEIKNAGTLNLAWFGNLEITGSNKLREAIYVDYGKMEFIDKNGVVGSWELTDNFIANGVGAGTYKQWIDPLALPAAGSLFNVISLKAWDNNALMTPGFSYEHMGALKPGYSYRLTLRFGMAELAGNDYQGDVTDPLNLKFTVTSTQVNEKALNALHPGLGTNQISWLLQQIVKQP